jgi:hypothetical protein
MQNSHPHFEAVKIALKQDKTGFVLTLNIHPDELDDRIIRDFVGARYQVVMVRLDGEEKPMVRDLEHSGDQVRLAGMLCRDTAFQQFLLDAQQISEANETQVIEWMKAELDIISRTEIREKPSAARRLKSIYQEFQAWKASV